MNKPFTPNKRFLLLATVLVLILAGAIYLKVQSSKPLRQKAPKPTITSLPSHTQANNGEKKPELPASSSDGTATNTPSTPEATTPSSQWITSDSGVITVQQPVKNDTLKPGGTLSGTASIANIQYRLLDNDKGVISQGPIAVNNGKFSASVGFQASAKSGRLDVFSLAPNGTEINEVQIPVNF